MKSGKKIKFNYDDIFVALGTFVLVPFILYFKSLFDGLTNVNFDGLRGYSAIDFYNKTLLGGEFPLWNKYVEGGVVMGSFHTTGLYPFAFLFSFLPASMFSNIFHFFHLSLGAFFFFKFLKELECDWYTSFAVALIYETSIHIGGYRREHFTIIVGIVYLPVILFFLQKYINKEKVYWLICAGISMGLQFLGSHTQIVVYTDLVIFMYLLINLIARKRNILKSIGHIVIMGLVYIGTMLGQLYLTGSAIASIESSGGKSQSALEYIKSFSIHYIKLFMMVFPKLFGEDDLMPFGMYYSSEYDIEIFLGFLVFLLVCFGVFKMRKRFDIRVAVMFMIASFLYATIGQIPFLAKIVAKIPVFNSFRVPSRMLFVFIFFEFVILALVLSETLKREKFKEILGFLKRAAIFTGIFIVLITLIGMAVCTVSNSGGIDKFYAFKEIFGDVFLVCLLIILISWISNCIDNKYSIKMRIVHILFCVIVVGITIAETRQYTVRSYRNSTKWFTEEPSKIEKELADENYKTISAFSRVGIQDGSFVAYNNFTRNKIQTINSYTTYNNMNIYKLLTGNRDVRLNNTDMFYAFSNMEQILRSRNNVLSILGVKYIIDSCDILSRSPVYYENLNEGEIIYENVEDRFKVPFVDFLSENVPITCNKLYKIEFYLDSNATSADTLYFDIYDVIGMDGIDVSVTGDTGYKTIYYYISDEYDKDSINIRMVAEDEKDYFISNVTITEIAEEGAGEYVPYYEDEKTRIYVNNNAKDILFSTQKVEPIDTGENIYLQHQNYDLLNVSYVTDYQADNEKLSIAEIEDIDFRTNSISATVSCDNGSFINFSQNYHNGWKAYIDGEKTEVYMVDETIMGIYVPKGKHVIKFSFEMPWLYVCIAVSVLTVILGIVYCLAAIYRDTKR